LAKTKNTKEGLGRGIRALLDSIDDSPVSGAELKKKQSAVKEVASSIISISVEQIEVNPFQPRVAFDEERLKELSSSIKVHGLIQPITVRRLDRDKYQLISGERRLRASKLAGISEVPAYIRLANDQEMLEMALIENIQREELNPIEISLNYQRLIDECSLKHEDLATRLGKNRSTVTNYLRLLKLPPDLQLGLKERTISMGHSRAILSLDDIVAQIAVYKEVVNKQLSVRQTETLVKSYKPKSKSKKPASRELDFEVKQLQNKLMSSLGTKVTIKPSKKGGEIIIPSYDDDDLFRLGEEMK